MPYRFDTDVTAQQKTDITRDFSTATGWKASSGFTRGHWLDRQIDAYVRNVVKSYRQRVAEETAAATAGADMVNLEE